MICQNEPYCPRRETGSVLPTGVWVQVRDQSGTVMGVSNPNFYMLPAPSLPSQLPQAGTSGAGAVAFDVNGSSRTTTVNYRVLVQTTSVDGVPYTGVVAIPLTDVHHTLGRLLLVEVLVSGVVLVGLGVLASWIVRRNLRPLDQMAATAGAIAGGDLSQRVATTDEYTEVGQLGNALNVMLAGIEGAFAAPRRVRRAPAPLPGRRLSRIAHPVDVDPGLLRALRRGPATGPRIWPPPCATSAKRPTA